MSHERLYKSNLQHLLTNKVIEVVREPQYNWANNYKPFMTDEHGQPVVRVGITNCSIDMNFWEGLSSPAQVGMFPLTAKDIWTHYACMNVKTTQEDGSPNPLAMPETFTEAKKRLRRIVIVCGMLVINPEIYEIYANKIEQGDEDPFDYYQRATGDVADIINKAVSKVALGFMGDDRAVVPMTDRNVKVIINGTRSEYKTGRYHGPCNNHWPHNSVAVMTNLMRFGVHRLPFRDELDATGTVSRFYGRYRSIIMFDNNEPQNNASQGLSLLDSTRLSYLKDLSDYTKTTSDITDQRYCPYNVIQSKNKQSICGRCLKACPSGALDNSVPTPDGTFPDQLKQQQYRFCDGTIDFDHGNCSRDRHQKAQLYDDYVCARCEVICAIKGIRKKSAAIQKINNGS